MGERLTVAVTGATGFVGRYVVRELLSRGFAVRALVRDARRARELLPEGVEPVRGSVLDGEAPAALVSGCGACIHLIGIIREAGKGQTFRRMHVEATAAMTEACVAAGARRFVHMSALGASDEGRTPYQRTKFEAEAIIRRSGLDWTIFRPGMIHGAESEFIRMVKEWAAGERAPWLFLPYFTRPVTDDSVPMGPTRYVDPLVQPVAVEDVAWCFAEALQRPETAGEIYNLVGTETFSWPDFLVMLKDEMPVASENMPAKGIPSDLAAAMAGAAAAVGLGGTVPFDRGMAIMGAEDSVADLHKVRAHFGLEPRPFLETVRGYAKRV